MECPQHTAQTVLIRRWHNLMCCRDACLQHDHVQHVHDLRVASRRLRVALKLFAPLCPDVETGRLYKAVRTVTREVGTLRDIDEALLFFSQDMTSCNSHGYFDGIIDWLSRQRLKESACLTDCLKKFSPSKYDGELVALAVHLPDNNAAIVQQGRSYTLQSYLATRSVKIFRRVTRLLPGTREADAVLQRHALRIAIKRWRYFVEMAAELTQSDYSACLDVLKAYQGVLGRLNDLAVFTALAEQQKLKGAGRACFRAVVEDRKEVLLRSFCDVVDQHPLGYTFHA